MVARASGVPVDLVGPKETEHFAHITGLRHSILENIRRTDYKTRKPDLETVFRVAVQTEYSAMEQVRDLFGLDERDFSAWGSRWSPRVGYVELRERLMTALEQTQAEVPTVADLASKVLKSCVETGVPGQWRARLFDVAGGWHFPHVAYNVVNFTRWYGPFRGPENEGVADIAETVRVGRYVDQSQLPYSFLHTSPEPQFLRFGVPGGIMREKNEPPVDKPTKQEWWDRIVRDRRELTVRLQPTLGAMNGYWGQSSGVHSLALIGSMSSVSPEQAPRLQHMWVEPAARVHPDAAVPHKVGRPGVRTPTTLILITGEQAMHLRRVADLIGEALGWRSVSNRDLVHRRQGRRVRLQDPDQLDLNAAMLRDIAANPPENMILAMNLAYMVRDDPHRLLPEVEEVLRLRGLQAISLSPLDPETLMQWQVREHGRAGMMMPQGGDTPESMQEGLARLEAFGPLLEEINRADEQDARARGFAAARFPPRLVFGRVGPVYPWGTPGVRPGLWGPAKWYEHPLIGDITVRVAYECAIRLLEARPVPQNTTERTVRDDFVPGSVLARYESRLRTIAYPDNRLWQPAGIGERFFDSYLSPPGDTAIPAGRTVQFETTWERVRPRAYAPADLSGIEADENAPETARPSLSQRILHPLPGRTKHTDG